jgi:hypothetical protein
LFDLIARCGRKMFDLTSSTRVLRDAIVAKALREATRRCEVSATQRDRLGISIQRIRAWRLDVGRRTHRPAGDQTILEP